MFRCWNNKSDFWTTFTSSHNTTLVVSEARHFRLPWIFTYQHTHIRITSKEEVMWRTARIFYTFSLILRFLFFFFCCIVQRQINALYSLFSVKKTCKQPFSWQNGGEKDWFHGQKEIKLWIYKKKVFEMPAFRLQWC